jgi:hypothetical protein
VAIFTAQVHIVQSRYFFLCEQARLFLHLSSNTSLSMNGSTLHTVLSDRQAWFLSQRVLLMISGSTWMFLDKVMTLTIPSVRMR